MWKVKKWTAHCCLQCMTEHVSQTLTLYVRFILWPPVYWSKELKCTQLLFEMSVMISCETGFEYKSQEMGYLMTGKLLCSLSAPSWWHRTLYGSLRAHLLCTMLQPGLSIVTSCTYAITSQRVCSTCENTTDHDTLLTFLWPILCHFGHTQHSHIPGFIDYARQRIIMGTYSNRAS